MIGSVHGCVSCPVVVKPWQPESLTRPQHPLPSPLHSQSLPYSMPQRSSSVHPWPQSGGVAPDDKTGSMILSPQQLPSARSRHRNSFGRVREVSPDVGSPRKVTSVTSSPQKTESLNSCSSPRKMVPVVMSQQTFAEQYEKLLEARDNDNKEFFSSSQHSVQSSRIADGGGKDNLGFNRGFLRHSESHTRAFKPKISESGECEPDNRDTGGGCVVIVEPKGPRESTANPVYFPDGAKFSSPPHVNRINFSPSPLPSIQGAWRMATKDQQPPPGAGLPPRAVRPSKVLPSLSNPKFQAVRNRMTPPPPSLCLARDRKRSTGEHENNKRFTEELHKKHFPAEQENKLFTTEQENTRFTSEQDKKHYTTERENKRYTAEQEIKRYTMEQGREGGELLLLQNLQDPFQYIQLGRKKVPTLRGQHPTDHPVGKSTSKTSDDPAMLFSFNGLEAGSLSRQNVSSNQQPVVPSGGDTPPHPPRDAPTPQSLDSSNWSFGQTAVAPEVDALTTAAAAGDMAKVKALLADGVDVNAVNSFGRTALQVMTLDSGELGEVLLGAGADPNVQDRSRRTASSTLRTIAHDVAATGHTHMLRCLLRHGADVNLQDKWGNTPLHLAAKGGHLAAVRLLRRGTSLVGVNLAGKTPGTLLRGAGNSAALHWLDMFQTTPSRLQTLSVLTLRRHLGPQALHCWRNHPDKKLRQQVLLQSRGNPNPHYPHPLAQASASTLLPGGRHSAGSRSLTTRGRGGNGNNAHNNNGHHHHHYHHHPLVPGMSGGSKQMTDFLTMRDLIPRRLSAGENTSLEVHNTSSGQSIDDVSLPGIGGATSSLASETGSLFDTNLSSIDASQSADDISLSSPDRSM